MFCTHCGASIQQDQRFCGACGSPLVTSGQLTPAPGSPTPVAPSGSAASGRVARHLRMLGVFWIALSAIHLLRGGGRLIGARMVGLIGPAWFDGMPWGWSVGHMVPAFLSVMGLISLALAAAGFAAGWGLLERRPWARTLAIVVAIIALLNPILGTLLGIYTLWVLLPSDAEAEWHREARVA